MTNFESATFFIVEIIIFGLCSSQITYDCPDDWYTNGGFCYKFEGDVPLSYDDARAQCSLNGAGVLSVESLTENVFILQWLQRNDPFQREWYTSGVKDTRSNSASGTGFMWESTGNTVEGFLLPAWLQTPSSGQTVGVIIYTFGKTGPGWIFADNPSEKRPYICKIAEKEAYRILLTNRGFDYGTDVEDMATFEKGPHFIVQPQSTIVVTRQDAEEIESVNLECVVQANPQAEYKWYMGDNLDREITQSTDDRYAVTNGKLTIENPMENQDATNYRCAAENKFGTVISNQVEIAFGSLGEFNNVPDAGTRARAFDGANLECSKINYRPAVKYQWIKGSNLQFVRPEFQDYIFISNSGKLYFQEVTRTDQANYTCIAVLTGVNRFTIGTTQPPMANSLPIPLIVDDQAPKSDWGPEIQDDFIAIFPRNPLRGQDVRMECFAYGSTNIKFYYSWTREDKPMPRSAQFEDHNRVLVIVNAQLEDSGTYRCSVSRGNQAGDTKTVELNLGAKPYFVSPLRDQHADIGSQLTWICNARASPEPTYYWYKNGKLLTTDSTSRIRVQKNVLIISQLDPEIHNGMYQCGAENTHGASMSNAQLRVLAFAPTLNKYPPPKSIWAPDGGNITLRCQPEGSPFPDIEWSKGGSPITSDGAKYTIFGNGNLHITLLSQGDRGIYTCKATNDYGEVQASTKLDLTAGAVITIPPSDVTSVVNRTVFLSCEASYPQGLDMVYEWTFNGFPLDYTETFFKQAQGLVPGQNGLYLIAAQFRHEGEYTCTARTPFNSQSRSAYLKMIGPPRQPAGVRGISETVTQNSSEVVWMAGSSSGGIVSVHIIQVSNEFEPDVWIDLMTVRVADSLKENDMLVTGRHSVTAVGLNPGTGYRFRVIAQNEYGRGIPSDPSPYIQTLTAPPAVAPRNLRGGGGSVGDLTIRWDPLLKSEYGAESVGYRIYWRKKDETVRSSQFGLVEVKDPTKDWVVVTVGADNYFLLYEVKIQALNKMGYGPNSTMEEVYSAEDLPLATPENVQAFRYNATAIYVTWIAVPDDRLHVRGKIAGYQINYWLLGDDPTGNTNSINYYGQNHDGFVIGLDVNNVYYAIDIQVYNLAGLGPRSNYYLMETRANAPLTYPQEVHVSSNGYGKVRVWWRGVWIKGPAEEGIWGYAIWLWKASEDFRGANLIEIPKSNSFTYVLKNISEHTLYAMRIAATGWGGYGKKTPTVYFAMEGEVLIDPNLFESIEIFNTAAHEHFSKIVLVLSCILSLCLIFSPKHVFRELKTS